MSASAQTKQIDAGKSPEQLCGERLKRIQDAIQLKQPDRIPVFLMPGNLLADMEGITRQELGEEEDKALRALEHAAQRFQPDSMLCIAGSADFSRILGDRMTKWPGYGLEANQSFQFHESEFMKQEDYDDFLEDPGDWAIRKYLPRAFSNLEGLALLPHLGMAAYGYYGVSNNIAALCAPPVATALEALTKAAQAQMKGIGRMVASMQHMECLGFPPAPFLGALAVAPFDFMADTLRGMRGIFLDVRRCPEKLLAAQEKAIKIQLDTVIASCRAMNMSVVTFPLHRGSDGFMSLPVFEKFYWPQLKKMFLTLIDAGLTPSVLWEGSWDQRLKYLAELPKGKIIGFFQSSDIFKVKEVLGDTMCIIGGMKVSMLNGGATAQEIRDYTRRLCKEVGKGGGFIMSTDILEMEGAKPELVEAWIDATREFGQY